MGTLSIDLETFSSVDIKKCGLYKYVQSADFAILLFAYAFDDEDVQLVDFTQGEQLPIEVSKALIDRNIIKKAYNAPFEWYCLSKWLTQKNPCFFDNLLRERSLTDTTKPKRDTGAGSACWLAQWQCTMHHGLYCGYPAGLGSVANAMGFPEDKKKMTAGRALIKKFCVPCTPTKNNGGRTRNLPHHEPEQWALFKEYCKQDVAVEREISRHLSKYVIPYRENYLWQIDQYINVNGIKVDVDLVDGAIDIHAQIKDELTSEAVMITGLDNPNSTTQLKEWIRGITGEEIESLSKDAVDKLIESANNDDVSAMMKLRKELNKTSIKKYHSMRAAICGDGRIRGLLRFYGANRTGRWAGRLVQVQNLPRNYINTLDIARKYVKERNIEALKLLYGNVSDTISQLIRTAFIPKEGFEFAVSDFSAIEARVIAWLADEQWRLDVFNTHGKIYEASASAMFGVPVEKIAKGNPEYALRQKGKIAELALGYQGSPNALVTMGALDMGLTAEELPDIIRRWRASNKRIVDFWYTVENAAVKCVEYGVSTSLPRGITFSRDENNLIITLPSGRQLFYLHPTIAPNQWGKSQVYFYGVDQKNKKWGPIPTYGGKLVENIVQAVARDCLAESIISLYEAGYNTLIHIHDECVIEVPIGDATLTLDNAIKVMCKPISWAEGLPLNADGFTSMYYKKD